MNTEKAVRVANDILHDVEDMKEEGNLSMNIILRIAARLDDEYPQEGIETVAYKSGYDQGYWDAKYEGVFVTATELPKKEGRHGED